MRRILLPSVVSLVYALLIRTEKTHVRASSARRTRSLAVDEAEPAAGGGDDAEVPTGGNLRPVVPGCNMDFPRFSENQINPVWQASYPGSGSSMTRAVISQLTGIKTDDMHGTLIEKYGKQQGKTFQNVVAVKTHYPYIDGRQEFEGLDPLFRRAILTLRNPVHAIPSFFNQNYEMKHKLQSHTRRGPDKEWVAFRDGGWTGTFQQKMGDWETFVSYWLDKYAPEDLYILSYEALSSDETGPSACYDLAVYLGRSVEGVNVASGEAIGCIWSETVNYTKQQKERDENEKSWTAYMTLRAGKQSSRAYTTEHLAEVIYRLQRLREKYQSNQAFEAIMIGYIEQVQTYHNACRFRGQCSH